MRVRLFFVLPLLGMFLCSGIVQAQSSITNNSGAVGFTVLVVQLLPDPSSEQQRTITLVKQPAV